MVGGGFIGIEMMENLVERGAAVTLVELSNQVLAPLDEEMAAVIQADIREKGVSLRLKEGLTAIARHKDGSLECTLSSGDVLECDMVLLAIGVRPDVSLAKDAQLALGPTGGIQVDPYLCTSDPHIYAVGDAIEVRDFVSRKPALIPLAGPANKQGRIAAGNIAGQKEIYEYTQGTRGQGRQTRRLAAIMSGS